MIVMPHPDDDPIERAQAERAEAARRAAEQQEEEEKRRSTGHGAADAGNPAHADLGANIRPDVVEAPGGLVTITTQKSATYYLERDDAPDPAISNGGMAPPPEPGPEPVGPGPLPRGPEQSDRAAADPPLTLALIEQNPWNAVELPLPENPPPELLLAAHKAAFYCADMNNFLMQEARARNYSEHWSAEADKAGERQPDVHEFNEAQRFQATQRVEMLETLIEAQNAEPAPAKGDVEHHEAPDPVASSAGISSSPEPEPRGWIDALHTGLRDFIEHVWPPR